VDSLKALDPERPIREADMVTAGVRGGLSGFHLHLDQGHACELLGEQLTIVPRGKRIAETRTTVIFCRCV
jgi:hypothetical protein